jgi:hypothetical protein
VRPANDNKTGEAAMRRSLYVLTAAMALLLVCTNTAVSAGVAPRTKSSGLAHQGSPLGTVGPDKALSITRQGYNAKRWTNDVNDTLQIEAMIEYDSETEKGRLYLIVSCWYGNPLNNAANNCKLNSGTKVWENFTTGGHISAPIGALDGSHRYVIRGSYRSMVDNNFYNSKGKDIYVTFHWTGRSSAKHTICSKAWSELYGTGGAPC